LTVEFVSNAGDGGLTREGANRVMATFAPGHRRLRQGSWATPKWCADTGQLSFATPAGFFFQSRHYGIAKTYEVIEFFHPTRPEQPRIHITWLTGDLSTSPTGRSRKGTLWATPIRWEHEKDGSHSFSFWSFKGDGRHNRLLVEGLKERPETTQALLDSITWDGTDLFRQTRREES
jgi:hypothetical protein